MKFLKPSNSQLNPLPRHCGKTYLRTSAGSAGDFLFPLTTHMDTEKTYLRTSAASAGDILFPQIAQKDAEFTKVQQLYYLGML